METEEKQSKHGIDASDKVGAEGSRQADNPRPEDIASEGEGEGLGGRTGAQGGGHKTEPRDEQGAAERRK
jgi:hypothetical protein